jgi:SHS2 domain-containing protein
MGRAVQVCNGTIKEEDLEEDLHKWFKEKWVRIDTEGNIAGKCGTMKKGKPTTRCLPIAKAKSLSKEERAATSKKKVSGSKKGKQFVPNTKKAKL